MRKKIILIVCILILVYSFSVEATNNFNSSIEYVLHTIKVDSVDGKYMEDIFLKYDSETCESISEERIIGEFTPSETKSQLHNLKLKTVYNFKEDINISLKKYF